MQTAPERIVVTAPIPIPVLKRKFQEDLHFVIDYKNSKFKGKTLITYLSNLDVPCSLMLEDQEESLALVKDYLHIPAVVPLPELVDVVINLLLAMQHKPNWLNFEPTTFIEENREILMTWLRRIQALPLYGLYCTGQYEEHVKSFPVDENQSIAGVNYVHLMRHPLFAMLLVDCKEEDYTYSPFWFNEYVFGGKNLYHYFAVPENPIHLALITQVAPDETDGELRQIFDATVAEFQTVMGDTNVSLPQ